MSIVIAVDGTAASGKGTLAKKLAAHFGFHYLDTGALYRLTALGVVEAGGDPAKEEDAVRAAHAVDPARASDPAIRTAEMGRLAAMVSPHPAVRQALLDYQREFARREPGAVLDGRDIGTVVCPDADVKFFVDAVPEVRAHRRWLELKAKGKPPEKAAVLSDIIARDKADRNRAEAPLAIAPGAIVIDTTSFTVEEMVARAVALVESVVEQ